MKFNYFVLILIGAMYAGQLSGQESNLRQLPGTDSLHKDTSRTAENLLLQQAQQSLIDSAIHGQLLTELARASGDIIKTRELQTRLRQIFVSDSLKKAQQLTRIEALKRSARGYPVALNADTLFLLYTKIGSFGAGDRASAISQRIDKLYRDYTFNPDSLKLLPTENGYDILYKEDFTIMSVAQLDALWSNSTADSLALSYRSAMIRVILREKKANSLKSWIRHIALMALVIMGLILVIYLFNKVFRRSARFITNNREKYAQGITFRKYRIFSPAKLEQFALQINKFLRIIAIVLCLYISLLFLSGIFTATGKWTDTLLGWILTPARNAGHGFINFLPSLFTIIVIYFIFKYVIKGVRYISEEIEKGNIAITGFHRDWAHPTFNIVKFLLYAFMIVLIFPYLPGSSSLAFRGVSVFLGVLISLGSSSAITNMVAGLVITYMRPFKIGDRVKIGEITGDVLEKNMLVTRIRTIKNEDVTVPNSTVLSASSINYSANTKPGDKGLILHTSVTIGYDTPWKNMHQALIDAAGRTEWVEKAPEPFVLQTSLDDFYVSYQLNIYTKQANRQANIYSQLHQNIQDCCNEAGIEILSPHYTSVRDGNSTSIPADYLSKEYVAPPFVFSEKHDNTQK